LDQWGDSVCQVAWSRDGGMLAAADMAGKVRVWRAPGFQQIWSFDIGDILWLHWHPVINILFCGTADSEMWMWKIPSGESKLFKGLGEKTECGTILPDGKRAMCGYSDGSLRLFDLKTGSAVHTMTGGLAHMDSVNSLDSNNNIVMSASMDGTAMLWNPSTGKNVGVLMCGERQEQNSSSSVETAIFSLDGSLAITGSLDGMVTVWDVPTQISRHSCRVGQGVTKLLMSPSWPSLVFAGTLDGHVAVVDVKAGGVVAELTGHRENLLDIGLAVDSLVTAADDGTCRVFDCRQLLQQSDS
jgi:WD40 repeat protein